MKSMFVVCSFLWIRNNISWYLVVTWTLLLNLIAHGKTFNITMPVSVFTPNHLLLNVFFCI